MSGKMLTNNEWGNFHNVGVGVDIEVISRFKKVLNNNKFLNKIYSKKELDYCFSKKIPAQHLAARFSAKEAIIKAIKSLKRESPFFNEIEILNNAEGSPIVNLTNYDVKISLSHSKANSIAVALVSKKEL